MFAQGAFGFVYLVKLTEDPDGKNEKWAMKQMQNMSLRER